MFIIPLFRGPSEVDWHLGKRALLGGQSQLRSGTIPTTGSWTSSAARGVGGYLSGRGCTQRRESDLARLRFFSAAAWRRWRGGFLCLNLILNERSLVDRYTSVMEVSTKYVSINISGRQTIKVKLKKLCAGARGTSGENGASLKCQCGDNSLTFLNKSQTSSQVAFHCLVQIVH